MTVSGHKNQNGSITTVVLVIVLALAFVAVAIFAGLTLNDKNHYKNDVEEITTAAVAKGKADQQVVDQKAFEQEQKNPYKTFTGTEPLGRVSFQYPKTWSAYVDQTNSSEPINGYFHPNIVPALNGPTAFALRAELTNDDYSSVLNDYSSNIEDGSLRATAYKPPKLAKNKSVQVGALLKGKLDNDYSGQALVIKVRDKTLRIYTMSNAFVDDFNKVVLKSLTFSP